MDEKKWKNQGYKHFQRWNNEINGIPNQNIILQQLNHKPTISLVIHTTLWRLKVFPCHNHSRPKKLGRRSIYKKTERGESPTKNIIRVCFFFPKNSNARQLFTHSCRIQKHPVSRYLLCWCSRKYKASSEKFPLLPFRLQTAREPSSSSYYQPFFFTTLVVS